MSVHTVSNIKIAMDKESDQVRHFSVALSRALDEIGLSEQKVAKCRDIHLYMEELYVREEFLGRGNIKSYRFGSRSEGTTILGLKCDVDSLECLDDYRVIRDMSDWTSDKITLLMLQEDTAPGYCRLQLLKKDTRGPETKLENEHFVFDSCDRVILKNSFCLSIGNHEENLQVNGPAITFLTTHLNGIDIVTALCCTTGQYFTDSWAKRNRHGNWPSQDLIHKAANEALFIVPTGHKLSPTRDLEWRISTSLAERCLMFSLNIVQIKCYVLLKMLVKEFITPEVGDCLSSYHCKTALFYCIEGEEAQFWHEENLLNCVIGCLRLLHVWVTGNTCPHYILANVNLFDGKVTPSNQVGLLKQVTCLVDDTMQYLLKLRIDNFGQVLSCNIKRSTIPTSPILDSDGTIDELAELELYRQTQIANTVVLIHRNSDIQDNIDLRNGTYQDEYVREILLDIKFRMFLIDMLKCLHLDNVDRNELEARAKVYEIVVRFVGFLLASAALSRNDCIEVEVLDLLQTGSIHDNSAKLKLCSVLYSSGDVETVELLLDEILDCLLDKHPACGCVVDCESINILPMDIALYLDEDETKRDSVFLKCVLFSKHEIHCAPLSLRYELFRFVGDAFDQNRSHEDYWMDLAVVDAISFLFFLRCITYRQLRKYELQKAARENLEQYIIIGGKVLLHRETAWNLLGQCYEMEQEFNHAFRCYKNSLEIRPTKNAANWLVSILIYKLLQQHNCN